MRLVIQRVKGASVSVSGSVIGSIGIGMVVLVGFGGADDGSLPASLAWRKVQDKLLNLRLFPDDRGRTNRSMEDAGGEILLVPQFTLYADMRKGRRPGFDHAAPPELAEALYGLFVQELRAVRPGLQTGRFGAEMDVRLVNWGPVTLILDSAEL
jgi:D-aminoacyl-tRNA deacylase